MFLPSMLAALIKNRLPMALTFGRCSAVTPATSVSLIGSALWPGKPWRAHLSRVVATSISHIGRSAFHRLACGAVEAAGCTAINESATNVNHSGSAGWMRNLLKGMLGLCLPQCSLDFAKRSAVRSTFAGAEASTPFLIISK